MKYIYMILTIALCFLIYSDISFPEGGTLPKDGNAISMQIGRSMRMYDDDITALEHLDENTFVTHTNWDVTNDIVDSGGNLTWTWADGDASTATQVNADMALVTRNTQTMRLTYTVSIGTALAGGNVAAWISGICDSTALDITVGVAKTLSITTKDTASVSDFVINIDPDANVSAGVVSIDNVYLTSYFISPVAIANTASVTLTVPDDTIELIIDSDSTEVQITIGGAHFLTDVPITLPILEHESIKIYNGSGGAASVSFYFLNL